MQEILNSMQLNGVCPKDPLILDGKVHRFKVDENDKGKSGWYCGFQNITRLSGQLFYVVRYGNFKTGLTEQYQTNAKYSPDDKNFINKQIEKQKLAADEERRLLHEETANECRDLFEKLSTDGSCPYLQKKKISSLHGARVDVSPLGIMLYVPLCDLEGKIWSLQMISSDSRGKRFYPNGRISGCFHVIGGIEESEKIVVCEGFATGCSIFEATGLPTVVAFQSGNLESVAVSLKQRYPEKLFLIAGDDDRWTTKPDGTPWNPGRIAAIDAAKRVMGETVFPVFKNLEKGNTTDFNDLHCYEGLDKVREQFENKKPKKHYIVPLGYNENDYFFLSNVNPQIQKIASGSLGSSAGCCRLQPLVYWENLFPAQKGEGVAWTRAADFLMDQCHQKGIFKPDRVRGRGVWNDEGRVIYHMGDRLWYDGQESALHRNDLSSKYIYESSEALAPVHSNPLSVEECVDLVAAAKHIRWKKSEYYMFYAGWVALAPISGALGWRPHIWLTGPSGSGKSYVMQEITYPLFHDFAQFFRGQTTEAGIRQKSGRSTMPVIFDEFETNDDKSGERIKSILELARQASSDSDGIVAKGTVHGDATEYRPQFSMMCASVRLNLVHEEDENRFTVLELARGESGTNQFETLEGFVKLLGREYGRRLFSRSIRMATTIRKSAEVFQSVIANRFTMRIGQQYGALLAGFWSLVSDEAVTEEKAKALIQTLELSGAKETSHRNDEMECLDYLMDKVISGESRGVRFEASIRELIGKKADPFGKDYSDALERIGIAKMPGYVAIHATHRSIKEFYKGSKWAGNFAKQIARIEDAINGQMVTFKTTHSRARCVKVPINIIIQE